MNGLTGELEKAQLADTLNSLRTISAQLEKVDWADRNNADEVLVLTSTFDVDESGASPSLNPGQTYTRWMWILVRTNGGTWQHVDHGY